jgi:hypothetical protein
MATHCLKAKCGLLGTGDVELLQVTKDRYTSYW